MWIVGAPQSTGSRAEGDLTLIDVAVGLQDTQCFAWFFLQKFLSKKIVKLFLSQVQNLIFLAVFLNL